MTLKENRVLYILSLLDKAWGIALYWLQSLHPILSKHYST